MFVTAEMEELLDELMEEFAGEDVIDEGGRLLPADDPPIYCGDVLEVTLLTDRSKMDMRLRGLNLGASLKGTVRNTIKISM